MALFGTFSQEMALSEGCSMGFDGRMLFSLLHWHKQSRHLLACHGKDHQTIVPTDTSNLVRCWCAEKLYIVLKMVQKARGLSIYKQREVYDTLVICCCLFVTEQ
jgi:hypothetical protein